MKKYSNVFKVLFIALFTFAFAWSMSCGGAASSASVLVSIAVTPASSSIAAGANQQFTATGTYSDSSTTDLTATVTWVSSDTAVADFVTADTVGLATGVASGAATITATDADTGVSGSTDMTVAALGGTIKNLYTNNVAWGTYLANDGADIFTATDTACNPASGTWYNDCLNGGFFRSVEVTGRGVCDGLTATDSLGVFNWTCDSNTNDVRMVSVGFADGMGLSDLVDFDTASWKQLNVTVYRGGNAYLATDPATLFSKTITINNTGANVNDNELHIVTSNQHNQYVISGSNATLLIKPGLFIDGSGAGDVIQIVSEDFVWVEGAIDVTGDEVGVLFETTRFSQLRNIRTQNADTGGSTTGIYFNGAVKNKVANAVSANNTMHGVRLLNSTNNLLMNIRSANNGQDGIELDTSTDNIFLTTTVFSNQNRDLYLVSSTNNALINITTAIGAYGAWLETSSASNTLMNISAVGGNEDGLHFENSGLATLANLALANGDYDGVAIDGSSNNYFTGIVKVGNNANEQCSVTGIVLDPGITDLTCASQGPRSDFGSPILGISLLNSFIAKASSDTANADGATGTKTVGSITDWVNFENSFRGWGLEGTFPTTSRQRCDGAETCRIWDWSMASADTVVLNVLALPTGDDTLTHNWTSGSVTFLRHAVEILDDGVGNDNGLCESNETCLYTPNIGSYQGHGNMISAGTFTDGTITGVTLMQYETNGR